MDDIFTKEKKTIHVEPERDDKVTKKVAANEVLKWLYFSRRLGYLSAFSGFGVMLGNTFSVYVAGIVALATIIIGFLWLNKIIGEIKRLEVQYFN